MQAYTELLPPTAVTHAVSLPFLQSQSLDLIVAKTSLLQIFQLRDTKSSRSKYEVNGAPRDAGQDIASRTQEPEKKLYLVVEYPLSGTITSLARIKTLNSRTGGEALLISFRDAKASLVEWNPETHGLSTISVHYYENEELLGSPWASDLKECSSYLLADPSSRCAALKFGQRHLAIIPFKQAGDDLAMEDYDPAIDEAPAANKTSAPVSTEGSTPYDASFVLQLTELDPSLIHVEHLAFLYEYREPTLGVMAATKSPSFAIAPDRKDITTYIAFTLDLQQRASTALISVTGLPSDLFKIVPLPLPIGGSLLIGGNEIIHVDQAGKTHGVGVNDFAKQASAFPMTDQSSLALRLEGSNVAQISSNGDVLLVLNTGAFVCVNFQIDGRSVSGFYVSKVPTDKGGHVVGAAASCACKVGNDIFFVGSEEADSLLVYCQQRHSTLSRKRSHAEMLGVPEGAASDEDVSGEDEDDLYGEEPSLTRVQSHGATAVDDATYMVLDRLPNLTACGEPVFGRRRDGRRGEDANAGPGQLELAMASGTGAGSSVAFLSKDIVFDRVRALDVENADRVWTLRTTLMNSSDEEGEVKPQDTNTDHVVISTLSGRSNVYRVTDDELEVPADSSFESEVVTLDAGSLCNGKRIVQVSPGEVRCYPKGESTPSFPLPTSTQSTEHMHRELSTILSHQFSEPRTSAAKNASRYSSLMHPHAGASTLRACCYKAAAHRHPKLTIDHADLSFPQIFPVSDESSDAEDEDAGSHHVMHSCISDPYVLLVRQNGSCLILKASEKGELDELDTGGLIRNTQWASGTIYSPQDGPNSVLIFLLSMEGALHVSQTSHSSPSSAGANETRLRSSDHQTLTSLHTHWKASVNYHQSSRPSLHRDVLRTGSI